MGDAEKLHNELTDRLADVSRDHTNAKNNALSKVGKLKKGMSDKEALDYFGKAIAHYRHQTGEGKAPGKDGKFSAADHEEAIGDALGLLKRYGMSPEEVIQQIKDGNLQAIEQYVGAKTREKHDTVKNGHYFTKVHPNSGDEKFVEDFTKYSKMAKDKVQRDFRAAWEAHADIVADNKAKAYK